MKREKKKKHGVVLHRRLPLITPPCISFGNKNEVGHPVFFFLVNSDGKGTENRFLHSLNDEIHYGIESS